MADGAYGLEPMVSTRRRVVAIVVNVLALASGESQERSLGLPVRSTWRKV